MPTDVFYTKSGYGETVVRTDYQRSYVHTGVISLLDKNSDVSVTRISHAHPDLGEPHPSGFRRDLTIDPYFNGDRNRFIDLQNPKYKNRTPQYHEVYVPSNKVEYQYNGEETKIKTKD